MIIDEPTTKPLQLDITAIDLGMVRDDTGSDFVICRMIDGTGLVFDVPIARRQAETFGNSLAAYAARGHVPAWL